MDRRCWNLRSPFFPVCKTGLLSHGSDLLTEVAQPHFDGAEPRIAGSIDEGIGHLRQEREGLGEELLVKALAVLVTGFSDFRGRRRGSNRSR